MSLNSHHSRCLPQSWCCFLHGDVICYCGNVYGVVECIGCFDFHCAMFNVGSLYLSFQFMILCWLLLFQMENAKNGTSICGHDEWDKWTNSRQQIMWGYATRWRTSCAWWVGVLFVDSKWRDELPILQMVARRGDRCVDERALCPANMAVLSAGGDHSRREKRTFASLVPFMDS